MENNIKELNMIWEGALGKVRVGKNGRHGYYKGLFFHHWTWNLYHPEDPKIIGDGMCIHHKDLNPSNDNISNLQKMTNSEHARLHALIMTDGTKRKISENHADMSGEKNPMFGKHHTEESNRKNSKSHRGIHPSEESNRKNSESQKGEKNHFFGKHHSEKSKQQSSESHKGLLMGDKNPNARAVIADYKYFSTGKEAAKMLNVHYTTIRNRIKSNKPGYYYLAKKGD